MPYHAAPAPTFAPVLLLPPPTTDEQVGADSWQAAAQILEHDRHLTQHELSQIDREICELQRSLRDLSDSTASLSTQDADSIITAAGAGAGVAASSSF
jgi:hypothetical protein